LGFSQTAAPSEQEMPTPEEHIREALAVHRRASASGNPDKEHVVYANDAICDFPQSGEGILGCRTMQPLPRHPGKPSGFGVKCTSSADDLWVTKQTITYEDWPSYAVSSVEFEDGGWSTRRGYFARLFAAPEWRSDLVSPMH
jgi:hypothetical protein